MSESAHCRIGASKATRWLNCPGSVRMAEGMPELPTSPYAEEGTLAHEVAAWCLLTGRRPTEYVEANHLDEPLPDDMPEAVQTYLDVCNEIPAIERRIERRVTLDALNPPEPMWGTADYSSWDGGEVLTVIDYKHGAGVIVAIENNDQVRFYALGSYLQFAEEFDTFRDRVRYIDMMIVQPRTPNPVRKQRIPIEDLLMWGADLIDGAHRVQDDDAPLNAGDWCRWCPAAAGCPALANRAAALAQVEFASPPAQPDAGALTKEELLQVMEWAPAIRAWLESVHTRVFNMAKNGQAPGWKVVAKRANRRWKARDDEVRKTLMKRFGLTEDQVKVDKTRSPAQMEKLLGKKRKKEIADLWEQPEGAPTLVRDTDKRKAISATSDAVDMLIGE